MGFLNQACLEQLSHEGYQKKRPYPYVDIQGTLTPQGFEQLRTSLPEVSQFDRWEGVQRGHGQGYHDRYILHYRQGVAVSDPWRDFIAELHGPIYQSFLRRMLGVPDKKLTLTMEWYYGWKGCAVSPHCDARRKLATHIFYFNTPSDWETAWGGNVLIMDDGGRYKAHSAPTFDDLKVACSIDPRGNGSLLFQRTEHSWHGVRPLQCPPDVLRKLFIVTVNIPTFQVWWRRIRGKDPDGYRFHVS